MGGLIIAWSFHVSNQDSPLLSDINNTHMLTRLSKILEIAFTPEIQERLMDTVDTRQIMKY